MLCKICLCHRAQSMHLDRKQSQRSQGQNHGRDQSGRLWQRSFSCNRTGRWILWSSPRTRHLQRVGSWQNQEDIQNTIQPHLQLLLRGSFQQKTSKVALLGRMGSDSIWMCPWKRSWVPMLGNIAHSLSSYLAKTRAILVLRKPWKSNPQCLCTSQPVPPQRYSPTAEEGS